LNHNNRREIGSFDIDRRITAGLDLMSASPVIQRSLNFPGVPLGAKTDDQRRAGYRFFRHSRVLLNCGSEPKCE